MEHARVANDDISRFAWDVRGEEHPGNVIIDPDPIASSTLILPGVARGPVAESTLCTKVGADMEPPGF